SEMESALHLPATPTDTLTDTLGVSTLLSHLDTVTGGASLSISNGLYPSADVHLYQQYMESLTPFSASVETLPFSSDPDGSRVHINSVIEEQTSGMIPDLLPPNSVGRDTGLILTNAIHFLGEWEREFDKSLTRDRSFHASDGVSVPTPFMHDRDREILYAQGEGWTAVEMPYADSSLAFTVYMPDHTLEDSLDMTHELWKEVRGSLSPTDLGLLSLPVFRTSFALPASSVLQDMGMRRAFTGMAQFGLMSDTALGISDVYHQAVIDVSEHGTEAAAATAVVMLKLCVVEPPKPSFVADRPFIYAVTDTETGMPLFVGRYTHPE
ncbi:serpin family protein, partial [Kipferlia bialata]